MVAALTVATSTQVIVTAMTPYAMSAHLALNMAWLWLFLRKNILSDMIAMVIAFLATGLHQLIFHPLFAAPFVVELLFARDWRRASLFSIAYATIVIFWTSYWSLMLHAHGLDAPAHAYGTTNFIQRTLAALTPLSGESAGLTAENLLRFVTWQNPLAVALAVCGAPLALVKSPFRPILTGIVLTVAVMIVARPMQGHGWGYRYLHGLIGNFAILAGLGWTRVSSEHDAEGTARSLGALAASIAFALGVSLPARAYEVYNFIHPYAVARDAIRASKADVIIVNPQGSWYGLDLVRNDPFLLTGPKVMDLVELTPLQIQGLCARYRVDLFDRSDAAYAGIRPDYDGAFAPQNRKMSLLAQFSCIHHVYGSYR